VLGVFGVGVMYRIRTTTDKYYTDN